MNITRATDLGLRVLLVLAQRPETPASTGALADDLHVPRKALAAVVAELARRGWVTTTRGRGGGVELTAAGRTVPASEVFLAFEGDEPVVNCVDPPCPLLTAGCGLRTALDRAQAAFVSQLGTVTVDELARVGV